MRSEFTIPPSKKFDLYVYVPSERDDLGEYFRRQDSLIAMLAGIGTLEIGADSSRRAGAVAVVGSGFEAYLYIRDLIDVDGQISRLDKSIAKTEKVLAQAERKLSSDGFISKAKPEVVENERAKAVDLQDQLERMETVRRELSSVKNDRQS